MLLKKNKDMLFEKAKYSNMPLNVSFIISIFVCVFFFLFLPAFTAAYFLLYTVRLVNFTSCFYSWSKLITLKPYLTIFV